MEEIIVELDLPLDDDGFLDRQCPDERCRRYFKVLYSDWDESESPIATCPFCGYQAEVSEFNTEEQQSYVEEIGQAIMQEKLQEMLGQLAKSMRTKRSSTDPLRIDVTTKFNDISVPISPEATASMRLQINCEYCNCTYAVVGAGFFCPLCGRNSAPHTFSQAIGKIRNSVFVAQNLTSNLDDQDTAEILKRDLLEDQIENLVTSFQRFGDSTYPELPTPIKPKSSPFQRLRDASDTWCSAGGRAFDSILGSQEWSDILLYFQKRHVLTHQGGFVDEKYISQTGDTSYRSGQKLIISEANVLRMADLVEKLASGMLDDLASSSSPFTTGVSNQTIALFPQRLPGVTELDWKVYRVVCELAVQNDHDNLYRDDLLQAVSDQAILEDDLADSLEILEDKGLVRLSHTMGSRVARHTRLTTKGLSLYYSHSLHNYQEKRKQIADLLLEDLSSSQAIADHTGDSLLFIHHIIREFESRDLVKALWTQGIAIVHVNSQARLKRLS